MSVSWDELKALEVRMRVPGPPTYECSSCTKLETSLAGKIEDLRRKREECGRLEKQMAAERGIARSTQTTLDATACELARTLADNQRLRRELGRKR